MATPRVFQGPAVEVQQELLRRLEEIPELPTEVSLGSVLLPPRLSLDQKGLIENSELIPTPAVLDRYDWIKDDRKVKRLIVANTIRTMLRAGQIQYLQILPATAAGG